LAPVADPPLLRWPATPPPNTVENGMNESIIPTAPPISAFNTVFGVRSVTGYANAAWSSETVGCSSYVSSDMIASSRWPTWSCARTGRRSAARPASRVCQQWRRGNAQAPDPWIQSPARCRCRYMIQGGSAVQIGVVLAMGVGL
jgi:hypothetical protein